MKINEIRTVLVDDEPGGIKMLTFYLEKIPHIKVVATFTDASLALEWLLTNQVDLLFTDIDMPVFTGIGLVKALIEPPQIIYCTSHSEFAADTFETRPVDFLLKPIVFDRLQQAIGWAVEAIHDTSIQQAPVREPYIFLRPLYGKTYVHVKVHEILYVKVEGNECEVKTLNKELVVRKTLKEFRHKLGLTDFIMVERSILVNKHLITQVDEGNLLLEGLQDKITIGPDYAAGVKAFVKSKLW